MMGKEREEEQSKHGDQPGRMIGRTKDSTGW